QMPNVILWHRLQVACDTYRERLASETKQLPQVVNDSLLYPDIGVCQLLLLQRAANKGAQQHLLLGRSTSKFDAAKGAGKQRSLCNGRHDKTHTIERMGHLRTGADQVHDSGGGIGHGL